MPAEPEVPAELADDSSLQAREFTAGKDAVTLATAILALDQEQFSVAFRKSPLKRAKLRGLHTMTGTTGRTLPVRNAQCAMSLRASEQFHFSTDLESRHVFDA